VSVLVMLVRFAVLLGALSIGTIPIRTSSVLRPSQSFLTSGGRVVSETMKLHTRAGFMGESLGCPVPIFRQADNEQFPSGRVGLSYCGFSDFALSASEELFWSEEKWQPNFIYLGDINYFGLRKGQTPLRNFQVPGGRFADVGPLNSQSPRLLSLGGVILSCSEKSRYCDKGPFFILHFTKRTTLNSPLGDTNSDSNASEYRHSYGSSSGPIRGLIFSGLEIAFGALGIGIGLNKICGYALPRWRFGLILILVSGAAVAHGTFHALMG